ncbi:hypothetical protein BDV18DRAFT_36177 [Aspergillus unguis]
MSLTPLDTGALKSLDFSVTLVYHDVYTTDELENATRTLLSKWPTLGLRLNLLRTALRPSNGKLPNVWAGKHIDKSIQDAIDPSNPGISGDGIKQLDRYFNFANGFRQAFSGQVLFIRSLHFQDATVIRFIIEHCLCDAAGGYEIARAYCNILNGNDVPHISFTRPPMQLRDEIVQKASEKKDTYIRSALVEQTRDIFSWSWRAMIKKGVKMTTRDILHQELKRVDDTIYIPRERIEQWKEAAKRQKVDVTEHDLLASFIYQCHYDRSSPQDMIIIFSIRRELQNQTPMHNSCILLPVPLDNLYNQPADPSRPEIAAEVRRAILEARRPEVMSDLLDFHSHSSKRPMIPRYVARNAPQASVTSWTHLPFFSLDVRGKLPSFVYGEIDFTPYMKKLGYVLNDVLINWNAGGAKGENGYFIRGRLAPEVWAKIRQTLSEKS